MEKEKIINDIINMNEEEIYALISLAVERGLIKETTFFNHDI